MNSRPAELPMDGQHSSIRRAIMDEQPNKKRRTDEPAADANPLSVKKTILKDEIAMKASVSKGSPAEDDAAATAAVVSETAEQQHNPGKPSASGHFSPADTKVEVVLSQGMRVALIEQKIAAYVKDEESASEAEEAPAAQSRIHSTVPPDMYTSLGLLPPVGVSRRRGGTTSSLQEHQAALGLPSTISSSALLISLRHQVELASFHARLGSSDPLLFRNAAGLGLSTDMLTRRAVPPPMQQKRRRNNNL